MANPDYKGLAKKLKGIGALNYDLRKTLSKGQKGAITKAATKYWGVITRPSDYFILKAPKKTIRNAHEAEYFTTETNIIVKKTTSKWGTKYSHASVRGNVLTLKETQGSKTLTYKIHVPGSKEFFKYSEKLANQPRDKDEYLTLKIGGNAPFNRTFSSTGQLLNYLSTFKLKDGKGWEEILPSISLVKIENVKPDGDDEDEDEEDDY